MALLITLYLIMANTYSSVQNSGPQDRNFGVIEIWMIGCQFSVFMAMAEYAVILYMMKRIHDGECEKRQKTQLKEKCCKQQMYKSWDNYCMVILPILFVIFNLTFWVYVTKL